eukprot:scaffold9774_cov143-Isochrysis_galbana.AAC.5
MVSLALVASTGVAPDKSANPVAVGSNICSSSRASITLTAPDGAHRYRTCTRTARISGTASSTPADPASATRAYSDVPNAPSAGDSNERLVTLVSTTRPPALARVSTLGLDGSRRAE